MLLKITEVSLSIQAYVVPYGLTSHTLAIQALYLNGRSEISDEEFDVHDRVAKEIDDLETLPIGNLIREVDILKINAEMHPLELDSNE